VAGKRSFTREDAEAVAEKLKAVYEDGRRPHTLAIIYYKGVRVAQFGIRRGSRKDQGHGFLPGAVHLSQQNTRRLADCPMSYEEWVAVMKEKRLIVETDEAAN
jgi:hypothetical protein